MAKTKRRVRRKKATKKRRRNPISKAARTRAAKKGARTRAAKKAARSAAGKKAARKRKTVRRRKNSWYGQKRRHSLAAKKGVRRRKRKSTKRRARRRNATAVVANPKRRRRRVRRRGPSARGKAMRRYRRRRNPANGFMDVMTKHAIPTALSLYISRLISGRVGGMIPGMDRIPAQFRAPALAGLMFVGANFASRRVPMLKKWRSQILVGFGINMVDKLLLSFAPANVSSMFGLGQDSDIYAPTGEYVQIGQAPPIDDDITLSEYLQIGQYFETEDIPGLEEDLGADIYSDLGAEIYADLGMEQDLGQMPGAADFADRRLGGVTRSSMQAAVPRKSFVAPVPERSFTKRVPEFSGAFDKPARVYTGIFGGGFGN